MTRFGFVVLLALIAPAPGATQTARHTRLEGDWLARAGDELRHIMVRSDSSAQFGDQVARWRVVGDSLWITLGDGVWQVYGMKLGVDRLTLAGGDLEKPVTLRRVGPPKARAGSVAIPRPPPGTARAWSWSSTGIAARGLGGWGLGGAMPAATPTCSASSAASFASVKSIATNKDSARASDVPARPASGRVAKACTTGVARAIACCASRRIPSASCWAFWYCVTALK